MAMVALPAPAGALVIVFTYNTEETADGLAVGLGWCIMSDTPAIGFVTDDAGGKAAIPVLLVDGPPAAPSTGDILSPTDALFFGGLCFSQAVAPAPAQEQGPGKKPDTFLVTGRGPPESMFTHLALNNGAARPLFADFVNGQLAQAFASWAMTNPSLVLSTRPIDGAPPTGEAPPGGATAPVNTAVPAVTQTGNVLHCTMGTWTGEPTAYAYQWQIDGANVGTNSADYTAVAGDVGKTATCVVTATNATGSTAAPPSVGVLVAA